MECQHLITISDNCDVIWYKLTKDKEIVQVSLTCSLTRAHMSSISVKGDVAVVTFAVLNSITGGQIDAISLHTCRQSNTVLALINGHMLCQLNINLSHSQLELTVCCNLGDDMSFTEAILGIHHSDMFYKLTYRHPLLLAVNSDHDTLSILVYTMVED